MAMGAPRERMVEKALALIVEAEIAPDQAAHARLALSQWRGKSPEHAAALLEARQRWDALGGMADDLRTHFEASKADLANASAAADARRPQRRKHLLSIVGLLGVGLLGGRGVHWYLQQPVFHAAFQTRTAQLLKATLTDGIDGRTGSRLDLAPLSAVDVTLYRQRRVVEMARGEVRFEVVRDADRPFRVRTREGTIEVIGTVFTVRDRGGPVLIGVERGHVRVRPLRGPEGSVEAHAVDLHAGELVEISDGSMAPVRRADTTALAAWRDGWLVFDNTPLSDALAAVNSYRTQPIVTAGPRIDAMRLSGRFRSNDSIGLLAALPSILPLAAVTRPDGSVELRQR
jgi:transmembrane sensor